jgi:hypothetical protein
MAFGLYSLLEAALLICNAVCVLHEERFLAKSMKLLVFNFFYCVTNVLAYTKFDRFHALNLCVMLAYTCLIFSWLEY